MALLEAWCQLACHGGELLLVCYDESWPAQLTPGSGEPAFACALLLAAGAVENAVAGIERPCRGPATFPAAWQAKAQQMPTLAALPLLYLIAGGPKQMTAISTSEAGWQVNVTPLSTTRGAS